MEYNKILPTLKRFSFSDKMRILQHYSGLLMAPTGLEKLHETGGRPLPWELETFLLFSIIADEWRQDTFTGKKEKHFENIINSIRNHTHPTMEKVSETISFADYFLVSAGAVQFDIQEFYPYKLYRYNYYFSFVNEAINMPELFLEKFGCSYDEFVSFAQFFWLLFAQHDAVVPKELFTFVIGKYGTVVSNLALTREEYIVELKSITTDISDYLYCLRPSYTYPFIIEGSIMYLPLPHLLMRSVTSSLLYRLTEGNNKLTELIGKEVLEPYLYQIVMESKLFDEVFPEQEYNHKHKRQRTLDVLARKGETFVFFDSKMHSPKRNLRTLDTETYEAEICLLADKCKQIYLHIHERFPELYDPFPDYIPVHRDNVYGLVVLRDDPHIRVRRIYEKTAELLALDLDSDDFDWLCKHVGIAAIYDVEQYCFTGSDIVEAVLSHGKVCNINDFWLTSHFTSTTIINENVNKYRQELTMKLETDAKDCIKAGVLQV